MWVKPIRSVSSELAFRVEDHAAAHGRRRRDPRGHPRIGEPFGFVLDLLDLPPELAGVGGSACLVEEAATGRR